MSSSLFPSDLNSTFDTSNQASSPEADKNDRSSSHSPSTQQHDEQHDHVSDSIRGQRNTLEVNYMKNPRQKVEIYEVVPTRAQLLVSNDHHSNSTVQGSKAHRYEPASPLKSDIKSIVLADSRPTVDCNKSRHVKMVDTSDTNVSMPPTEEQPGVVTQARYDNTSPAVFQSIDNASFNAQSRGSTSNHATIYSPIARPTSDPTGTATYNDQRSFKTAEVPNPDGKNHDELFHKHASDPEVLAWETACAYQNMPADRRVSNMTEPEITFRGHRDSVTLVRYKAMHEDAPNPGIFELGDSISVAKKRMQARKLDKYRKT